MTSFSHPRSAKSRRPLTLGLLLAAAFTTPALAQSGSSVCWLKVRPAPQCGGYLVTEAGVEIPIGSTSHTSGAGVTSKDFRTRWTIGVGGMMNRPDSSAIGGLVTWDVNRGWSAPMRGEARYRKWTGTHALDFSGGIARQGIATSATGLTHAWGPTAGVGIDYRYIGADVRAEVLRGDNQTMIAGFVGGRATSAGAPIAVAGALLFIVGLVAAVGAS